MLLIQWLLPVLLHEAAHTAAALGCGVKIKRFGVRWFGPYVVREAGTRLQNLCISLAGPGLNLALGVLFWRLSPVFAQVNLVLGVSNLLPVPPLDGFRIFQLLRLTKTV